MKNSKWSVVLVILSVAACATSPTGRRQLMLMSAHDMDRMGLAAYRQISEQTPVSRDRRLNRYVGCVAGAVIAALDGADAAERWEVSVFRDSTPNAFALPGGKIGVNTGLLLVAKNQSQLASVLGHEVAHVLAGHANERISAQYATRSALVIASAVADTSNPMHRQAIGLLGAGAQVGILLPYGRAHESEADIMGLDLMARAGFDPRQSVQLWRNMAEAGRGQPPEFLSTHPSHGSRISQLEDRIPGAMKLYQEAAASGRRPDCR
jgi:predicted Zn-dependent protease